MTNTGIGIINTGNEAITHKYSTLNLLNQRAVDYLSDKSNEDKDAAVTACGEAWSRVGTMEGDHETFAGCVGEFLLDNANTFFATNAAINGIIGDAFMQMSLDSYDKLVDFSLGAEEAKEKSMNVCTNIALGINGVVNGLANGIWGLFSNGITQGRPQQ